MKGLKLIEVNVDDIGRGGVYSLVRNIIKNAPQTIRIDIAALEPFEDERNIQELREYGCSVYFVGYRGNKILKQFICFRNLFKLFKRENYDCVHIHSDVANKLLVAGLAAKLAGAKRIILHSHASGVDGKHRVAKRIFHACCRRFLRFIGTTFMSCSDLASNWMFPNVPKSEVRMLKNGVDLNKFKYDEAKRGVLRKEIGVEGKFVVGHVGRFAYQKNHDYLIEVFYRLHKVRRDAVLLLVGEGPLQNDIMTKVKEMRLAEDVIFWGTSSDVAGLFLAMDVFALPSHFEGLPIVGVEAQASGLPVVFSSEITREAKLLDTTEFIPIDQTSIDDWVSALTKGKNVQRLDASQELKQKGFGLEDAIDNLISIYRS